MKKLILALLLCALCLPAAMAAQWGEGLSASKPYATQQEVNLDETMGYIIIYPCEVLPVEKFCDVLEIYLPRTDLQLGSGRLTLYDGDRAEAVIDFADREAVEIRPLLESELEALYWGDGACVEVHLPKSLAFGRNYHVLMDEGCFTASNGAVKSPAISNANAWTLALGGDYGVGGLTFEGDAVSFDLKLGGDAVAAALYSDEGAVSFEVMEFTESGAVSGSVNDPDGGWGVVFLDEAGEVLDVVALG